MKPKDETKELAIIDQTLDIVYKNGFAGIKMAELAGKVGISPSTLYVYFRNKEDLIVSICIKLFKQMSKQKNDAIPDELPYKMKFKKKWLSLVDYGLNNTREVSFLQQIKQSSYYDKVPKTVKEEKFKSGMELIEQGKKEGLIKDVDNSILLSIMGSISSETINLINTKKLKMNENDLNTMFLILWDALKT